jgi:uncharacterized protein YndB with AHSA1/START domain
MEPIVNSIEISRRPEEVFRYVTDPSRLAAWQKSVVSARADGPTAVGCKVVVTRQVGRMERAMTAEIAELTPPRAWKVRGTDGPIREMSTAPLSRWATVTDRVSRSLST